MESDNTPLPPGSFREFLEEKGARELARMIDEDISQGYILDKGILWTLLDKHIDLGDRYEEERDHEDA